MSVLKNGQWKDNKFVELDLNLLKYDDTIVQEPDGTYWAHIFHHNNPANARFANTYSIDEWKAGFYENADKWFNVNFSSLAPSYEFLVKQKTTSDATEYKYRWIQNINPWYATYNDVVAANVTKINTDGYTVVSYAGGMYWLNTGVKMCIANASSGNWYGGIGVVTAFQGGIPGYPNTVVTTGYIDLYVKIYTNNKDQAQIIKNLATNSIEFYEY